jgi:small subunit ribosomal protein S4
MHNYFDAIYEARYVSGVVAGMKLNEMIENGTITADQAKIGYVGAFPYAEVISGFTSFYLGVLERQFRNMFDKAAKADGITGEVLLQNLECRLDNVVYRLGIAPTRAAARQLVGHKHIVVDGKVVNIPSFAVKPGMVVGVREKSKSLEVIEAALAGFNHSKYPWIEWDDNSKSGKFLHKPERADIPENIKEQLIVELYSK